MKGRRTIYTQGFRGVGYIGLPVSSLPNLNINDYIDVSAIPTANYSRPTATSVKNLGPAAFIVRLKGTATGANFAKHYPGNLENMPETTYPELKPNEETTITLRSLELIKLIDVPTAPGLDGIDHMNIKNHIKSGSYEQMSAVVVRTSSSIIFKPLDDIVLVRKTYWYQPPAVANDATQAIPEEIVALPRNTETTIFHTYVSPIPGQNTFTLLILKSVGTTGTGIQTHDNPVTPFDANPHPWNPESDPNTVPTPTPTPPVVPTPSQTVIQNVPQPIQNPTPTKTPWFSQDTREVLDKTVKGVLIGGGILLAVWAISAMVPKVADSYTYATVRSRQLQR